MQMSKTRKCERRGEDADKKMEEVDEWYVGYISAHKAVNDGVCDSDVHRRESYVQRKPDLYVKVEWYYVGPGYDPLWYDADEVLNKWKDGCVHSERE